MPPFTVLHVCMGNICRSPMAERLFVLAIAEATAAGTAVTGATVAGAAVAGAAVAGAAVVEAAGDPEVHLLHSHSAGTGGWHAGEDMHPSAARQVRARGGDPRRFAARRLRSEHIDGADLVLPATADQQLYVTALRPDAGPRTFVLGEVGRLLPRVDLSALPKVGEPTPESVYARGVALVAALDAVRAGASALPGDDLDDPWGRGEKTFARVADEIDGVLRPLAAALVS